MIYWCIEIIYIFVPCISQMIESYFANWSWFNISFFN